MAFVHFRPLLAVLVCVGLLAGAAPSASGTPLYLGPGGCDVSDTKCVPPPPLAARSIAGYNWDGRAGLRAIGSWDTGGAPTWLHRAGQCLLATLSDINMVASYRIGSGGQLALVSNVSSLGVSPVYLDSIGKLVVTANYHGPDDTTQPAGAGVASLLLQDDCQLASGAAIGIRGSGPNKARQGASHVHSVVLDQAAGLDVDGKATFFACDLGGDAVYTFSADASSGKLEQRYKAVMAAGSGPRHIAVHPSLRMLYVIYEMGNTVTAHSINATGGLTQVQGPLPTIHFSGFSKAAEILISPDGDALFATNRGYSGAAANTIATFSIGSDGRLTASGSVNSGVSFGRGAELAPGGKKLLVAGQSSGNLVSLDVHESKLGEAVVLGSGMATPTSIAFGPSP